MPRQPEQNVVMDLQRTRSRTARWLRRRLPWLLLLAAVVWIITLVVWIAADPVAVNQQPR